MTRSELAGVHQSGWRARRRCGRHLELELGARVERGKGGEMAAGLDRARGSLLIGGGRRQQGVNVGDEGDGAGAWRACMSGGEASWHGKAWRGDGQEAETGGGMLKPGARLGGAGARGSRVDMRTGAWPWPALACKRGRRNLQAGAHCPVRGRKKPGRGPKQSVQGRKEKHCSGPTSRLEKKGISISCFSENWLRS